ncbi:MAG: isoprenylcysteine carboxylmethyltransferase family protein [Actinomycetia bacterium]|nr:isoprenylcysteine carboxylmethyltransferase family protein [Actinomycetes bacterium]
MQNRHRRDRSIAWSFVGAQVLLLGAIVMLPRNATWISGAGAMTIANTLIAAGIALGVWSASFLKKGLTPSPLPNGSIDLVTKGPYVAARHPMYSAVIILCIGLSVRSGSLLVVIMTVALIGLFSVKSRWEEMHLVDSFPGYRKYSESTGRFLPLRRIV